MSLEPIQLNQLDAHFADFVARMSDGPHEYLWLAAAVASSFSSQGHVCLDLNAVAGCEVRPARPEDEQLCMPPLAIMCDALSRCSGVGAPGEYTPLVLDRKGRLYLHRSWDAERRVAEGILSRCAPRAPEDASLTKALDRLFPDSVSEKNLQRAAAEAALRCQFTVISGGPGTGKTTTVARILALLVEMTGCDHGRILLAAPTGKAALRLQQSLAAVYERLPLPKEVRELLPRAVSTVHRLLGIGGDGRRPRYNGTNQLPCDVLVVDEASMVDLPLMAATLEALPASARVILLGDRDQLASVEAGAVLADLCAVADDSDLPGTRPAIVHLTHSYRFRDDSGIGALSRLVNAGDGDGALGLLLSGQYPDVCWRPLPAVGSFAQLFATAAVEGFAAVAHAASPHEALAAMDRFRVLTPHREGVHGTNGLNRMVAVAVRSCRSEGGDGAPYTPVMVGTNNYELGLFNGDTGIEATEADGGTSVYFPLDDGDGVRRISSLRFPNLETAYALTVHKSQGSEYDAILLILPDMQSSVMSRELLYTALTRARHRVEIWCDGEVFKGMVERRTKRNSGLQDSLWNRNSA
jgi:exodeoxyribonuclease V alpha subunit